MANIIIDLDKLEALQQRQKAINLQILTLAALTFISLGHLAGTRYRLPLDRVLLGLCLCIFFACFRRQQLDDGQMSRGLKNPIPLGIGAWLFFTVGVCWQHFYFNLGWIILLSLPGIYCLNRAIKDNLA